MTNSKADNFNLKSSSSENYELKKKFAIALHKAMLNHQEVRQFIKDEALKQFNGDYDVLYNYVSGTRLAGSTFRDIIASYYENESDLDEIENVMPSLTIFVPSLPQESFSAESWNVAEELPMVAIRQLGSNKVPLISSDSDSYLLAGGIIPSFPVVVIKRNERITLPSSPQYNSLDTREYISHENGFSFKFSTQVFNNLDPVDIIIDGTPEYLVDAWEVNGENQNLGWHRDYIYYQLQPTSEEGPYINDYTEFITNFKIEGTTGADALSNIADTPVIPNSSYNDSQLADITPTNPNEFSQATFWTDGNFEFGVNILHDEGQSLNVGFQALPTDLFEIEYDIEQILWFTFYIPTDIKTKVFKERHMAHRWKLHSDSNRWKFVFQELDSEVDVSYDKTTTFTSRFNTNFELGPTETLKIGGQLGGSVKLEGEENEAVSLVWKEDSNDLKEQIVEFGDNIIINEHSHQVNTLFFSLNNTLKWYILRRYDTGFVSFSLMPIKVQ